jgi:pimeloyl-ACP methyl ester carboxylesterase
MPGRGQSDWLPTADYNHATYLAAASTLIARLGVPELDWVGTSMGGLLGMILAAQPGTPIRKLVLNDVGAFASREAQLAVVSSTGNDDRFNTFQAVVQYLKKTYVSWGKIDDDEWINIAKHSSCKLDDGTYSLTYDPNIVTPFKENQDALQDVNIWPLFEAIQVPMLLLHGCDSTILTSAVAQEMKRRNANLELVDFPGIGHCPSLMEENQVKIVREWLQK